MTRIKPLAWWPLVTLAMMMATLLASCGGRDDAAAKVEPVNPNTETENGGVASPAGPGGMAPHLAVTSDGKAVLSWLEPEGEAHTLKYATLEGTAWSTPKSIAKDDGWFVNWADVPSVVPLSTRQWAAHWLVKRPGGTYSYDIALARSADGGATWSSPLTPHTDNTPTEHGFVTLFPWSDSIGAVWLDGRNMPPDKGGEPPAEGGHADGGMTLRFARLDYDGQVLDEGEIDNLVCDCCQTDVAMSDAGPVVAYRDRSSDEIRDISVARHTESGWAEPITVSDDNWKIAACPVNGPTIAAEGQRVAVAWYGAPNRKTRIKLAWSEDGGRTFSTPILIDDEGARGRVDVVLLPDDSAAVSWVHKSQDGSGQLRMRRVTTDGQRGEIEQITAGEYSRNAGFPQMVRAGDRIVFTWPEPGEPRRVQTKIIPLGDG